MRTLDEARAAVDVAIEKYTDARTTLYRGDGAPMFSEAEQRVREAALLAPLHAARDRVFDVAAPLDDDTRRFAVVGRRVLQGVQEAVPAFLVPPDHLVYDPSCLARWWRISAG